MVNVALQAARKAGELIVKAASKLDRIRVNEKSQHDYVSEVDRKAEEEIIYHLRKAYPDHRIICEESGIHEGSDTNSEWIIDPLDGTTNFLRGIPQYAVSIAYRHKGRLEHAVVYDPVKLEEFTASRGRGAQLNGSRIRVSARIDTAGALYATGIPFSGKPFENMPSFLATMSALAENSSGIRRMGAASLDLAYVAAGRFDAFWEMHLQPWDIAAGVLLVKEAGGMVSDFQGGDRYLDSGHIVATTPRLLKPTLQTVRKHLGHLST